MKRRVVAGIYIIISPSGRVYVGQSFDVFTRWRSHKNDRRSNGLLQRSFRKYGFTSHAFAIVAERSLDCDVSQLNELERYFISRCREYGYDLLNLNEGGRNARRTPEQIEYIRRVLTGRRKSPETCRRISESKKGEVRTAEHKRLISKKLKGRPALWLQGKKLSPEHVEKIRLSSTGRKHTEQFKRLVSERNKQNYHLLHSKEARQKRSEKLKGRTLPAKQRENMRLAQLRRWERARQAGL